MADVVSLPARRARRDHARFLELQAEFNRLGFALDPLTEDKLIVQRWGMHRVLDDVDAAQRLLDLVRSDAS